MERFFRRPEVELSLRVGLGREGRSAGSFFPPRSDTYPLIKVVDCGGRRVPLMFSI